MRISKTLFAIALSSLLISCKTTERPDAYSCVLINVDDKGNRMSLDIWYWFCVNQKTKEEKTKWVKDSTTCIRDATKSCQWFGTDVLEYDKAEQFYLEQSK